MADHSSPAPCEERLQKIISRSGSASRREAEQWIRDGRVCVNGRIVREMGTKANPHRDEILVDGKRIVPERNRLYVMLYKPRGYVTTRRDPEGRPVVMDLVRGLPERVFPVGRLDYDAEGLLLLTNDGDFAFRLQHPRFRIPRTYRVRVSGHPTPGDLQSLSAGFHLADGPFRAEDVRLEKENLQSAWLLLTIREGRNRIVKRAFAHLGYRVERLVRTAIREIGLGDLTPGAYRFLTRREVSRLSREADH